MANNYIVYDNHSIALTKDKHIAYHFMQELSKRGLKVTVEQTKEERNG